MSSVRLLGGLVFLVLAVVPPFVLAATVRRRWWPEGTGAAARLADVIAGVALMLANAQLSGLVGWFAIGPMIGLGMVELLVAAHLQRSQGRGLLPRPSADATSPRWRPGRDLETVTIGVVVMLTVQWVARVVRSYANGIVDADSLHYHLPHAARWYQTGDLLELHYVAIDGPPNMFHPGDSELLHSIAMAALDSDVLSPALNLLWLGVALLAAWVAGRPFGVRAASVAVIGAAVVLAMPFAALNAGTALNDVAAIACLLSAVAFLLQPEPLRATYALAGTAAALALSIKLTSFVPIVTLTLLILGWSIVSRRVAAGITFAVPLAVFGSFWFIRNLVNAGSPVPSIDLRVLPVTRFPHVDATGFTVADYLTDGSIWREWFLPGLGVGLSAVWWAVAATVALAIVVTLGLRDRVPRFAAVAALVTAVAYLVTPNTAQGEPGRPIFFALNLRYAFPAIVLGLVLLPLIVAPRRPRWLPVLAAAYVALFLGSAVSGRTGLPGIGARVRAWELSHAGQAIVVVGLSVLALAWGRRLAERGRSSAIAAGVTSVLALSGGLVALHHWHHDHRWSSMSDWSWGDSIDEARIAISGFGPQYPYYGRSLDNHVQAIGREADEGTFVALDTCEAWQGWLVDGDYDHIVLRRSLARELGWTETDPRARPVLTAREAEVYELRGDPRGGSCR